MTLIEPIAGTDGLRNSAAGYGLVSRTLHWSIALLIVAGFALGLWSGSFERTDPVREPILFIHKSIGIGLLALIVLRIGWIFHSPAPALPSALKTWEVRLAWWAHRLLYILMLAVPLSGIMLSQSAGREVSFFGLVELPQIFPFDPSVPAGERPLVIAGAIVHKVVLKWLFPIAIALHVVGAIKHHYLDGHTAFIRRMWR